LDKLDLFALWLEIALLWWKRIARLATTMSTKRKLLLHLTRTLLKTTLKNHTTIITVVHLFPLSSYQRCIRTFCSLQPL